MHPSKEQGGLDLVDVFVCGERLFATLKQCCDNWGKKKKGLFSFDKIFFASAEFIP